jgi:hypothetical protein
MVVEMAVGDPVWCAACALMEQAVQSDGDICRDEVCLGVHGQLPCCKNIAALRHCDN